ncbi:hypothetical protein JTB14_012778 [Gonioctena quinquepunctata]|nr:hypothetical protein JTB14_012778 [Gonioctena quinquepunctata]
MTLIEGIGDEVIHFFITFTVIVVVCLAWWTTNTSEQRHVRTVLLLERRRRRSHQRLTNHTEAVTITEGTNILQPVAEGESSSETNTLDQPIDEKPPEASTSSTARVEVENQTELDTGEEQSIIETMDADTCILRQRRLAFYENHSHADDGPTNSSEETQELPQPTELPQTSSSTCRDTQNEDNIGQNDGITIKLKYINDDLKIVDANLEESLDSFKKRHFQPELSANKLVRLIFNGQVLQPDTQTLKVCGLFDNCVVHCLIHKKRQQPADSSVPESRREGYSFPIINPGVNLNNNNQNRDWDLGNLLFAMISLILLLAWYFRYVYAHMYTVTATVGLILITGIFTIVLVGMYFPDNEHYPNPTFHIARERVQQQPQQ